MLLQDIKDVLKLFTFSEPEHYFLMESHDTYHYGYTTKASWATSYHPTQIQSKLLFIVLTCGNLIRLIIPHRKR